MHHLTRFSRFLVALPLAGLCSCAAVPETSPGKSLEAVQPPAKEPEVKRPFMIREASLPKGFPAPGPVGVVILKEYPAYRAARMHARSDRKETANSMFNPLFQHIKSNDIAMTAPVEMTYGSNPAAPATQPVAMAFLYGDTTIGKPQQQGDIEVIDLPAQSFLSVGVRGSYDSAFTEGLKQLTAWLEKNPGKYTVTGPARFLGYNSPFVPWFMRIGEVQVPVAPVAP